MKKKLPDYAFSKVEIEILREVASGNHSLYLLRKNLSIKPNLLSYNLKKILKKNIIAFKKKKKQFKRKRNAPRKYVYFGDSKHASLLRELLVTDSHMKWKNILSGLGLEVLFQVLGHSEITFESFSKATFWRYSRVFMAQGIIKLDDQGYRVNPRFSILIDFLTEYQQFIINTRIRSVSETAVILWQKNFECLIRVPRNSRLPQKGFLKTATSVLHDFGIQILSDSDTYFYSKKRARIRIEDAILHTLLIERDNIRYVLYSLLLLKKELTRIDKEYLLKEAQRLDLSLQINAMLQFLKTRGKRRGLTLPTWAEFMTKAEEYNVVD
jgi:hypothetical protein